MKRLNPVREKGREKPENRQEEAGLKRVVGLTKKIKPRCTIWRALWGKKRGGSEQREEKEEFNELPNKEAAKLGIVPLDLGK